MKVVIVNTSDIQGGAAVAANRLCKALLKHGVEAGMLVLNRQSSSLYVSVANEGFIHKKLNFIRFLWERGTIFLCNHFSRKNLFQLSLANTGTDITDHPLIKQADVIHLHWINHGFLSLHDLRKLFSSGKPVVWTLHDLWPLTGICHYPDACTRYQTLCFKCPKQQQPVFPDLAKCIYTRKQKSYISPIHFVGCSRWITEQAKQSGLAAAHTFNAIPNPIDSTIFIVKDKKQCRRPLHLPADKRLLLFAAAKVSNERKGVAYLVEACRLLKEQFAGKDQPEILLMGGHTDELVASFPFKVHSLGYLSDTDTIVNVYNSADLFVVPSLEDNLPNTIMEAMACGTPCVGFSTGGIPEMIDHGKNGYVARQKDAADLAKGIRWVLMYPEYQQLRNNSRTKAETCYSEERVSAMYLEIYQKRVE
ncbi:MAG: glycosyltransferase family 4 protein [Tannerellaceae bacterium]|nr:glycosyltransferase family 4 protein [Tannerellaceae bacterium]